MKCEKVNCKKKVYRWLGVLLFSLVFMSFQPDTVIAQVLINGRVEDIQSKKSLGEAVIVIPGFEKKIIQARPDGSFQVSIDTKTTGLEFRFVGYEPYVLQIQPGRFEYIVGMRAISESLQQVSVIGTRNISRTNVQTAVPIDIIPIEKLSKESGHLDLNQLLSFAAPSFQSSRQTIADGTDHIDPAQLRGLGTDQVLVLVNGKRRHQSALVNVNGTVNRGQTGSDLNTIPLAAIERIEILRDGAAAQYGSDAIAGVINIVLKQTTGVLSGSFTLGENFTSYAKDYALDKINQRTTKKNNINDGGNFQAALNYGISLGKRGYVNLSGEYALRDATNRTGTYTGQLYPNVNGVNRDDSILNARGLRRDYFDMRIGNSKITNGSFVVNAAYAINEQWTLKVFGTASLKKGEAAGFYRYPSSINSGAGIFAANVLAIYPNGFLPLIKSDITDNALSVGLDGKIGKWNASLSNSFGINRFDYTIDHSINYSSFGPGTNSQTRFSAGGVRFLQNTINADFNRNYPVLHGLNIAFGSEYRLDRYTQVAGEEASYKNYDVASGAAAGAQVFAGFVPTYAGAHNRHNIAGYIDIEQDFTSNWMLAYALRYEHYSDFGNTLNYKIASRYQVGKHFTIRAATSTGFRAPSLQQSFYAKTNTLFVSTQGGLVPTESGTFTNDSKPAEILGIPKLKEETSQNYSFGIASNPFRGFEISLDAYLINIKNRIILTNNFSGGNDPALTQLLKDNGATTANFFSNAIDTRAKGLEAVISYQIRLQNQQSLKFGLAASLQKNEVRKGADGKPIINASEVLLNSGQIGSYFNREDQSRFEVATPQTKGIFTINYGYRKLAVMFRLSYFGKVSYLDPTIDPANPASFPINAFTGQRETLDQDFSGKTTTDLSFSYPIQKGFTITIGANNLFDVYQDLQNHSGNQSSGRFLYSRRVEQMGFNGRFVFSKISFIIH